MHNRDDSVELIGVDGGVYQRTGKGGDTDETGEDTDGTGGDTDDTYTTTRNVHLRHAERDKTEQLLKWGWGLDEKAGEGEGEGGGAGTPTG